jgi:hypothetical protein
MSWQQTVYHFINQTIAGTEHNISAGRLAISKIGGLSTFVSSPPPLKTAALDLQTLQNRSFSFFFIATFAEIFLPTQGDDR